MKKKLPIIAIALLVSISFFLGLKNRNEAKNLAVPEKKVLEVTTANLESLREKQVSKNYSGIISSNQEITVTAKAAGVVRQASFENGTSIGRGSLLARIDDFGTNIVSSKDNFQSNQIIQSQLSLKQAKENYERTKESYENKKDDSSSSEDQLDSAKSQIEIAKLQKQSAQTNLQAAYDAHLITSPISGTITKKHVSVGDSVNVGSPLFSIATTNKVLARFFVEKDALEFLQKGSLVKIVDQDSNEEIEATIKSQAEAADEYTYRFMIEATLSKPAKIGTIATVKTTHTEKPLKNETIILPIEAITVTQNESYVFANENGQARKVAVQIENVRGELAEVSGNFEAVQSIVIQGAKLLNDGAKIIEKK